jgi:hypothetical protein
LTEGGSTLTTVRNWGRWVGARAVQWWWLDVPIIGLTVTIVAWQVRPGTGVDLLGQLSLDDRRDVYGDIMQLAALFAGFSGVIFAVYLGMSSRGVRQVKDMVGKQLLGLWLFALTAPWIAAIVIVLARVLDRGQQASPNAARWLVVGAILLVAVELLRSIWIFYQLAVIDLKGTAAARPTAERPLELARRA